MQKTSQITTGRADTIATIQHALEAIGVASGEAHDRALACVQRCDKHLRPIVEMFVTERLWQETMGDESGLTSYTAFAASGLNECHRAVKIARDVARVQQLFDSAYEGRWSDAERVRAAAHLEQLRTVVAEYDHPKPARPVLRMIRPWLADVNDGGDRAS